MALGLTSIALIMMPRRRLAFFLGFLVCAALMGWAFWLQYGEGLDPCPLCMLQRVAFIAIGLIFLVGTFHEPGRVGAWIYALLILVASRHRRGARGAPGVAAVAAEGPGARVRHGALVHARVDAVHRRDRAACSKAAANAPRRHGCSSASRSPAGRSRSSSRSRSSASRSSGATRTAIGALRPTADYCGAQKPTPTGPAPSSDQFSAGTNARRVA